MSPTDAATILGAFTGLVVAVVSLVTARKAAVTAARAQAMAGSVEQLRVRGTKAGDDILDALGGLLIAAETISFNLNMREATNFSEDDIRNLGPMALDAARIRRLLYANAIYLEAHIAEQVDHVLQPFFKGVTFSKWPQLVETLRSKHCEIAKAFRTEYLDAAIQPSNRASRAR